MFSVLVALFQPCNCSHLLTVAGVLIAQSLGFISGPCTFISVSGNLICRLNYWRLRPFSVGSLVSIIGWSLERGVILGCSLECFSYLSVISKNCSYKSVSELHLLTSCPTNLDGRFLIPIHQIQSLTWSQLHSLSCSSAIVSPFIPLVTCYYFSCWVFSFLAKSMKRLLF